MARTKGARNKSRKTINSILTDLSNNETQTAPDSHEQTSAEFLLVKEIAPSETGRENTDSGSPANVGESDTGNNSSDNGDTQAQYKESLNEFNSIIESAKANAPVPPEQKTRGRRTKNEIAQEKIKVPGRMFALAADRLMANGMCIVDSFTNKQPETLFPSSWLFADDKTLDELAPLASAAASELGIDEYPSVTMFALLISNQMSQFMQIKALIRQEKKKNPDFDITMLEKPKTS